MTFVVVSVVAFAVLFVIPPIITARLMRNSNACVNNLRQIDGAKQQWALENGKGSKDVPTVAEISVYLGRDGKMPICPLGGIYTIGRLDEDPTCSIADSDWPNIHALSGPNRSWWSNVRAAYGAVLRRRQGAE